MYMYDICALHKMNQKCNNIKPPCLRFQIFLLLAPSGGSIKNDIE